MAPAQDGPARGWGFLHYSQRRPASWVMPGTTDADDIINYLIAVVRRGPWAAITLTENSRRGTVARALSHNRLRNLRSPSAAQVKSAFVSGAARTLWLRGTHRRASVKPDNKVLAGMDLRDALDPIGDQTYRYTAVRCDSQAPELGEVIGVAVDQARMWASPSDDWTSFVDAMDIALDIVATAQAGPEPLPVLAISGVDLTGVVDAFDIGITPPELLTIGPTTDPQALQELAELETLAYSTTFDVTGTPSSPELTAQVSQRGALLGDLDVRFEVVDDRVLPRVTRCSPISSATRSVLEGVCLRCSDPETVSAYFDSGHSIVGGQVCLIRHRDVEFDDFVWGDFTGFDIAKEKPSAPGQIGNEDSLFCWMLLHWPARAGLPGQRGWLLCDDRPGETCDFVHLDESNPQLPVLSLVHVKAAKSASVQRDISVVAYETVTGQAVKNLRHLDRQLLQNGLSATVSSVNQPVWRNGQTSTVADLLQHLAGLGANFRRRVIVVQPHLRQSARATAQAATQGAARARLTQLNTILVGDQAICHGMGAELLVVGDSA